MTEAQEFIAKYHRHNDKIKFGPLVSGGAFHGTFLRSKTIIVMKRMKIQDSKLPGEGESNALQKAKTDVQKPERLDEEAQEERWETESWHTFKTP
jgi:hypothetical protein